MAWMIGDAVGSCQRVVLLLHERERYTLQQFLHSRQSLAHPLPQFLPCFVDLGIQRFENRHELPVHVLADVLP